MSSSQKALPAVSCHRSKIEQTLPAVPLFDEIWSNALLAVFKQSLQRRGGALLEPPINGDVLKPVRDKVATAKVVYSMVPEIAGNCQITDVNSPAELPNVQFVIVRASSAVIESGAVLLNHHDLRVNAVALLARHLIVLLDPVDIVVNLKHALRRDGVEALNHAPSHTCTSASAEIEGVLIHAGHGIRSLSVLPLAKVPTHRSA
jgi:L-lactate dehydrogenase complex protein LldG